MKQLNEILAKSKLYGETTLSDHTEDVVLCIEKFADKFHYPFDRELAKKGALLHDLGKAHPKFQNRVCDKTTKSLLEKFNDESIIHRHELSSLAFLPVFPKEEWPILIDLVVAHHKSIDGDKGLLNVKSRYRYWIDDHLQDWDEWFHYGKEIIRFFGYSCPEFLSKEEAKKAMVFAIKHCEGKSKGWSAYRGLLKAADHFASAFIDKTEKQLENLFEVPDISFYTNPDRQNYLYHLSFVSTNDSRPHTMVIAPTGAGKTDFLLRRTKGRIFYTLPFQASINSIWKRFRDTIPNKDVRLLHATSKITVGNHNIEEQILQPLVGSSVKVLTPHQIAGIVFGISGYETILLDLLGCDVILDEVHTYSGYSQSMVLEIVKVLKHIGCRIHIGTATIPSSLYESLLELLGGVDNVYEVKLNDKELDTYNRHCVFKLDDFLEANEIIEKAIADNLKVLLVFNTVRKAQEAFEEIARKFPKTPKLLIHSRFKRTDRFDREVQLKDNFNERTETKDFEPCIVVSTQVVEVSLDISFDLMITECAPFDALVQRFGRINRVRNKNTIGKMKPVYVIAPQGSGLPYKKEILEKTFEILPSNGEVLNEKDNQKKIDAVYPNVQPFPIDIHLKFRDGQFLMKELTDNKKSVLIDALEIEGATCILESDRDAYIEANWEERIQMEIPMSWKVIKWHIKKYEQLKIGSYPFVIPQKLADYEKYGLQLVEHDNFI